MDAVKVFNWETPLTLADVEGQPELVKFALEKHWEPVEVAENRQHLWACSASGPDPKGSRKRKGS